MSEILEKIKKSDKDLFVGLAGPGTGKSHTFKLIAEDSEFKNKNILILSFINNLVNDLEDDFKNFKNVEVSTLHSFASNQFKKQNINIGFEESLDDLISKDFFYLKKTKISFEKKIQDNNLNKDEESFYKKRKEFYEWNNEKLYSFNSIIYALIKFFSDESKIPDKYDLILIDEFQDFNKLEWDLIKLLGKKSKIVLVGDDDQSLYSWRKAKPKQIRMLYDHKDTEGFSLDECYRCTKVIIQAVNDLVNNAKQKKLLDDNKQKIFKYPNDPTTKQKEASKKYTQIDFMRNVPENLLIYNLSKRIKEDFNQVEQAEKSIREVDRILVLAPYFLKHKIYEGLVKKGLNVVEHTPFSDEKNNEIKHSYFISAFSALKKRKTDNVSLRKILFLYLKDDKIRDLILLSNKKDKKLWHCLDDVVKRKIEKDIEIFKKVKSGEDKLENDELQRFSEIFNLKNILSKLVKGFYPIKKEAPEIEVVTAGGSKGLSAEFVYYVGIDDKYLFDRKKGITDEKICEFLVGISRAKKKLTLFSLTNKNPKILEFLNRKYINCLN